MGRNFGSGSRGTAFILTFLGVLLISGNTFGAGGTCPSGANYLNTTTNSLVTLSSLGVTSCYYIAANGSDTNNGTSEATPWLHAPQMPSCSGNCATVQNQSGGIPPGTGLIFRGGDTWHFGNSGATPYTGGVWNFNTGKIPEGTSSNPIYVGVDPTWYSGSSWGRPILTADNPLCNTGTVDGSTCFQDTSHTYEQYYVSSCPYQISGGNDFFNLGWVENYIIDNFELTGLCQSATGAPGGQDKYVYYGSTHGNLQFTNLYIHGWSHLQFAGTNGSSNCTTSTVCFNILAFNGSPYSSGIPSDIVQSVVVDGSDSDPVAGGVCYGAFFDVTYSVFRYTSQCITTNMHVFHDNLYEYFFENGHSNALEESGTWSGTTTDAVYNNVFRHLETSGGTGGVGIWLTPLTTMTDYVFNNLMYDEGPMECYNVGANDRSAGTQTLFNNTFEFSSTTNSITCEVQGYTNPLIAANNHFITETNGIGSSCSSQLTSAVTNLQMTHSTATSAGYTSSETYAFSPASVSAPTVAAGTNEGSANNAYCSALSTAAATDSYLSDAATACLNDTRYACTYNSTNHTVACPARTAIARPSSGNWDIGAYQFGNVVLDPPTNLQATPH